MCVCLYNTELSQAMKDLASMALSRIRDTMTQDEPEGFYQGQTLHEFREAALAHDDMTLAGTKLTADDRILQCCLYTQQLLMTQQQQQQQRDAQLHFSNALLLLSNDNALCIKASINQVRAASLKNLPADKAQLQAALLNLAGSAANGDTAAGSSLTATTQLTGGADAPAGLVSTPKHVSAEGAQSVIDALVTQLSRSISVDSARAHNSHGSAANGVPLLTHQGSLGNEQQTLPWLHATSQQLQQAQLQQQPYQQQQRQQQQQQQYRQQQQQNYQHQQQPQRQQQHQQFLPTPSQLQSRMQVAAYAAGPTWQDDMAMR